MVKKAARIGMNFGGTSGVITTLGLIVGLHTSTNSRLAVIGGILTIAIADALSDAFGIHLSEESQKENSHEHAWQSMLYTFLFKFFITLSFLIPVLILNISTAIYCSLLWGMLILIALSFQIARNKEINPWKPILEHIFIAIIVILLTYSVGHWISSHVS